MFWFETKPEKIKNQEEFIAAVLRKFTRVHAGSGGCQIGRYIAEIHDKSVKKKFVSVVKSMSENPKIENWQKQELEIAKKVIKTWKKERR